MGKFPQTVTGERNSFKLKQDAIQSEVKSSPVILDFFSIRQVYTNHNNNSYYCGGAWLRTGLMAQWITRLPTEQKIAGSSPAEIGVFLANNS